MRSLDWPDGARPISDELEPDGTVCFRIEAHPAGRIPVLGAELRCAPALQRWTTVAMRPRERPRACLAAAADRAGAAICRDPARTGGLSTRAPWSSTDAPSASSGRLAPARPRWRWSCAAPARDFLADDVLALQRDGAELLGHPGSPVAGLDHAEAERTRSDTSGPELVGANDRELTREDARRRRAGAAVRVVLPRSSLRRAARPEVRAACRCAVAAERHVQFRARHPRAAARTSGGLRERSPAASRADPHRPVGCSRRLAAAVSRRLGEDT